MSSELELGYNPFILEPSINLHPDLQAQDSNLVFYSMELKTAQLSTYIT